MKISARLTAALLTGMGLLASQPAMAMLGFDASLGAGMWSQNPSGNVFTGSYGQNSSLDLKNDLNLKSNTRGYFWFQFEHPLPVIPDIRLEYSTIDTRGDQTLSRSVTYAGTTYSANVPLHSQFKLTQGDAILYYQPLATVVHIRLGLDVKDLAIKTRLSSGTQSSSANANLVVPMLYAGLGVDLPLTGLSASVDGSYIGDGSSSLSDYKLRLAYTTSQGIGLEAGYRQIKAILASGLGLSSSSPFGDIRVSGAYLGVFYDF